MVAVTIDLWTFGFVKDSKSLVVIAICNDGSGNRVEGNYKYCISHQFGTPYAVTAAEKTKIKTPTALDLCDSANSAWVWKSGRIKNFKRQDGAASLLAAVLKDAKL